MLLAPFGTAGDRLLVLLSLLTFVALLVVVFRFIRRLLGPLVALLAVAVVLTRTDMELLALRAVFDLPFYVLVLGRRGARAGPPAARDGRCSRCSASPGCCGPRRGCSAVAYWLWLVPATPRPLLVRYALLVAAAPVLWLTADLVVTGEPLLLADLDPGGLGRVRAQPRARARPSRRSRPTWAARTGS